MARILIDKPDPSLIGDINGDGKVTLGELIGSALLVVLLLSVILNVAVQGIGSVLVDRWPWGSVGIVLVSISVLIGGALGIWRVLRYEIGYKHWLEERQRQWDLEDQDRNWRYGMKKEADQHGITQADIDSAIDIMLTSWFKRGTYTRAFLVPKQMTEPRWNAANNTLKACKLRTGLRVEINAENYDEAWAKYLRWRRSGQNYYVTEDTELIRKE